MKRITYMLSILCATLFCACDKMDDNGELAGTWQLLEWNDLTTQTLKTEESRRIYVTVKLELIQFRHLDSEAKKIPLCLSRFHREGNHLRIGTTYKRPKDEQVPLTELAPYGVSPDGLFVIERLDDERLILKNSANRLTFRRY